MKKFIFALGVLCIAGCSDYQSIKTVDYVDLNRFMGKWYVIANIPTFIEKDAHNAFEIYQKSSDGKITTTFRYNKASFDGELVEYHPVATVVDDGSNAIWKMQFIWPFKADYRVIHIDENYKKTIIGRIKRDYVWIMARTPDISEEEFNEMLNIVRLQGYDSRRLQRVPHQYEPKELVWRT